MASPTSGSGPADDDFGGVPPLAIAGGCCLGVLALLIGVVSLVVHHQVKEPGSPYRVSFSASGDACHGPSSADDATLILDERTGEVLYCSVLPKYGDKTRYEAVGAFNAEEVAQVSTLAQTLARRSGLSAADRDEVERRVTAIAREHGHEDHPPSWLERTTGTTGPYGLGVGLVLLVGLGLGASYLDR